MSFEKNVPDNKRVLKSEKKELKMRSLEQLLDTVRLIRNGKDVIRQSEESVLKEETSLWWTGFAKQVRCETN